jgi:hypothetical protein
LLGTGWDLANIYLLSCSAKLLADDPPLAVGMSVGTTCFVSMDYFRANNRFADFVVHEAAHVFHNRKRHTVGLPDTRRREWLLEIDFIKRETFAYSCEAYSRILELGDSAHARRKLYRELESGPMPGTNKCASRTTATPSCRRCRPQRLEAHPHCLRPAADQAYAIAGSIDMTRRRKPAVTAATFRSDPLFPRIERAVASILETSKMVTPIDVLVGMQLLTSDDVEDWRHGRVAYLESVINCNLTRLSRVLRILRVHVHDLNLVPSTTDYRRLGKGPKHRLRFTKTGDVKLETAYATHFSWPSKSPLHPASPATHA